MKYISIAELGRVVTGKTPPTDHSEYFGGEIPFITPSDIETYDKRYVEYTERTLTTQGASCIKGCLLPPKSICFVCIGSTIGKSCMTKCVSYTNQQINSIIPNQSCIEDYLFYLLKYIKGYFQSVGGGTGSGKGIVNKTLFQKTKVEIHNDLNVQQRIASILSAYDDLIENNNRRIKILEQMAENLYKEWFVRFRFPGHEQAEFENGIPKGWQICRMSEFCYVTDGTHDTPTPVDVGVPLITGKCICSGTIDFSLAYNISHTAHEKIKKRSGLTSGDILFSNIGTVGNCCIVDYDREFSVKNMIIFKPETRNQTEYLYYWMTNAAMQEIFSAQTNGASQQFVGLTFMRNFKILVPTEEILTAFADKISIFTEHMRNLRKCNLNLTKQRDLLLPRLMSGKLEV